MKAVQLTPSNLNLEKENNAHKTPDMNLLLNNDFTSAKDELSSLRLKHADMLFVLF